MIVLLVFSKRKFRQKSLFLLFHLQNLVMINFEDKIEETKSDEEEDEFGGDIEKLEEAEKNLINEINIEEKNFRMEINEQKDIIQKININIKKVYIIPT